MFVLEVFGNQMGAAYVKRERIEALYVVISDSFCWPHVVPARAFSIESRCLSLSASFSTWAQKVSVGSRVTPRILGCFSCGSVLLLNGMIGCVFSSRVWELKSVTVDFCAETCRARSAAHCATLVAWAANMATASAVPLAVTETVKSSAYEVVR